MAEESIISITEDQPNSAKKLRVDESLSTDKQLCDVIICVKETKFPCHKSVLISSSPYFKAMFTCEMLESKQNSIILKDITPAIFKVLLDFMYTSKLAINPFTIDELIASADYFQISSAMDLCFRLLEQHLDKCNCFMTHHLSDIYVRPNLRQKTKAFILRNFLELSRHQEEFLKLTTDELAELISSDLLKVANEEDVFKAIVRWNNSKPEERNNDFYKVLEHVRLPHVSPYFLHQVEQYPAVKHCAICTRLVNEAKQFHLMPFKKVELWSQHARLRKYHSFIDVILSLVPIWPIRKNNAILKLYLVDDYGPFPKITFCTILSPLPFTRKIKWQSVAGYGRFLYLIGGQTFSRRYKKAICNVFKYNLEVDEWKQVKPMAVPRFNVGVALLNGYIYAIGGRNQKRWLNSVEYYDPPQNSWMTGIPMPVALTDIRVVSFDGCIYAAGFSVINSNENQSKVATMLCFNPESNEWTEILPRPCLNSGFIACIVDNQIHLIDGIGLTVQSYDPRTKTWQLHNVQSYIYMYCRPGVAFVNGVMYFGNDKQHPTHNPGLVKYKAVNCPNWTALKQDSLLEHVQWSSSAVLQISKNALQRLKKKTAPQKT